MSNENKDILIKQNEEETNAEETTVKDKPTLEEYANEKSVNKNQHEQHSKNETETKSSLNEVELDDQLNVSSESFNPFRALYAKELKISKKPPPIQYQNLSAFDTALKKFGVWGLQQKLNKSGTDAPSTSSKKVEEPQVQRRFLPHQMPIKAIVGVNLKQRNTKNLLKWIEKTEGPFKVLADAIKSQEKLHVVLRNECGVRGYVEGKLISYDKHWNLLMRDVLEKWRRRKYKYGKNQTCEAHNPSQDCTEVLKELGITLPSKTVKSLNRKNVEITRKLEQLFIRGEQVVLVNILKNSK